MVIGRVYHKILILPYVDSGMRGVGADWTPVGAIPKPLFLGLRESAASGVGAGGMSSSGSLPTADLTGLRNTSSTYPHTFNNTHGHQGLE